jgi:molybdate transport system ATP-binding protein
MSLHLRARIDERDLDVELAVARGETVALLGPNGAGKSSVLAVAAGLLRPDVGEVVLDGRRLLSTAAPRCDVAPHRRQVALLAQDPLLFPHLSLRENVAFGPRSTGASRRTAHAAADAWLGRVGLADLAERRPATVSGGQAQRAAVARALAAEPMLLLLDEPMAALDAGVTPALRQTLRRVLAERTTLLVTHDPLDALVLADRVVVLQDGRVVEEGRSREVLARPRSAFAARLSGLNLLLGTWDGAAVVLPDGRAVQGMVEGQPISRGDAVVVSFRPQAVAVFAGDVGGSPRNSLAVTVTDLESLGDLVRVRAGELRADITPQAAADLDLAPGSPVRFTVKATEVAVYGL